VTDNADGAFPEGGVTHNPATPWFTVSAPKTVCGGCKGDITLTYNLTETHPWGLLTNSAALSTGGKTAAQVISVTGYAVDDFPALSEGGGTEQARGRFDRQYHNFGHVPNGGKLIQELTLQNEGEKTLVIRAVQMKQGAACSLEPGMEVLPGETKTFTVELLPPADKRGRVFESIMVTMNDPGRPVREIRLSANIE